MKKFLIIACAVMLVTSVSLAGKVENYSMTQVTKSAESNQEMTQKYFVSGDKVRIEMSSPDPKMGLGMTVIADQKANHMYMMYPDEKIYWESPMEDAEMKVMMEHFKNARTIEKLGTEKILGEKCTKEKVETEMNIMNQEIKTVNTVWKCDKYEFPLKIIGDSGAVTEVTEIKEGKQDPKLFVVPKDYKKVANMMEAMKIKMQKKNNK